jgi:alpha-glucuronidase
MTFCPDNLLLWFHRLPWDYRLRSGRTLWEGLVLHYNQGVEDAGLMVTRWEALRGRVDEERYQAVLAKLRRQSADAASWRDKILRYFQQFSYSNLEDINEYMAAVNAGRLPIDKLAESTPEEMMRKVMTLVII